MINILLITFGLFVLFELSCRVFAWYVTLFIQKAVKYKDQHKEKYLLFIRQVFYRVMLLITILLMNHFYVSKTFYQSNQWLILMWTVGFVLLIVLILWWLNALIIRSLLMNQQYNQSFVEVFKQKISYIMLNPRTFEYLYIQDAYLKKSNHLNHLLSLIALIMLFLDVQILYSEY